MIMQSSPKKILITAGGTGGHLYPAQALAQQLDAALPHSDILFAGGGLKTSHFFDRSSHAFQEISCGTLSKNPLKLLKNAFKMINGIRQSLKILRQFKPDVVVGFGSYYTIPILVASKICKIPFILHEANSVPGKANRWLAPHAAYVGVHFPFSATLLKGQIIEVGLPIRKNYSVEIDKDQSLDYYGLDKKVFTLLVFGGSQGASAINQLIEEALPYLNGLQIQFIHLVGRNENLDHVTSLYKKYLFSASVKVFEEQMHFAWKSAHLFIGRAGASTIAEAMEFEVPGVLIPFPHATDDHQSKNADFFVENVKGGVKLDQKELSGSRLANEIKRLLLNNSHLAMQTEIKNYKKRPNLNLCQLILKVLK